MVKQRRVAITWTIFILVLAGFVSTQVAVAQDTTPPVLQSFSFEPSSVDVSNGPAVVSITLRSTDDLSGVRYAYVPFTSPGGVQWIYSTLDFPYQLISGDANNGLYQTTMSVPQFSETGVWHMGLTLRDQVGNTKYYSEQELVALGFPTTLQVTANQDTTPPVLQSFSFEPSSTGTDRLGT